MIYDNNQPAVHIKGCVHTSFLCILNSKARKEAIDTKILCEMTNNAFIKA